MKASALFQNTMNFSYIFLGCLIILFWILFMRPNYNEEKTSLKLDYLYNNWKNSFIYDIILENDFCSEGYESLKLGETERIVDKITNSIIIDSYPIYTYRRSLFCVRKSIKNYISFESYSSSCSNSCGYIDSLGNKFCSSQECPIVDIMIIDSNELTPDGYVRREFQDGVKSLVFTNKVNNSVSNFIPIVNLQISLGEICAHPLEKSVNNTLINDSWEYYSYYNECKTSIGGTYLNPHFTWIDADYGANFLPEKYLNHISNSLISLNKLNYDAPMYNLYGQVLAGINTSCKERNYEADYKELVHYNPVSEGGSILSLGIILVLYGVLGVFIRGCGVSNKSYFISMSLLLLALSIVFLTVAWVYYTYQRTDLYTTKIADIVNLNSYTNTNQKIEYCFDAFTVDLIELVYNHYSYYFMMFLFCSIMITIASTYWLFIYLYICYIGCCFKIDVIEDD
jgi:hypothetical protein